MRIVLVTPVEVSSTRGNAVTARRWQGLLAELGHDVRVQRGPDVGVDCDLLVALHARKSAAAIRAFRASHPARPVVLAMTGTDLYGDLPDDTDAVDSVASADRIVLLQPAGIESLPASARDKCWVIRQSVAGGKRLPRPPRDELAICVLAHLRAVKDPLLPAQAVAQLQPECAVHVTLAGAATDDAWAERARVEDRRNARFTWVGELPTAGAAELLARSDAIVVSSRMEGGANVIGEAIVLGVPVLATDIPGNVGLLGADYPAYFPVGDGPALTAHMQRAAADPDFLTTLAAHLDTLRPDFAPARERATWASLIEEL